MSALVLLSSNLGAKLFSYCSCSVKGMHPFDITDRKQVVWSKNLVITTLHEINTLAIQVPFSSCIGLNPNGESMLIPVG